ncbi:MAG: hypothetical protein RL885_21585 [Planctomycetota bacterium]
MSIIIGLLDSGSGASVKRFTLFKAADSLLLADHFAIPPIVGIDCLFSFENMTRGHDPTT